MSVDDIKLIKLARKAIELYLAERLIIDPLEEGNLPDYIGEKSGVFTTLKKKGDLRGCIGFPEPVYPLGKAIVDSAISAATRDPRFQSVTREELDTLDLELTILTPPEKIEVESYNDYLDQIEIGRDGLIVNRGPYRGLLLPQVPVEWNWNKETFLEHTCQKAGLPIGAWKQKGTEIYKFQGRIIHEKREP
ncbi:MAG: TIGR00296 family protein [Candidatus Hodarchaeales archaeon]